MKQKFQQQPTPPVVQIEQVPVFLETDQSFIADTSFRVRDALDKSFFLWLAIGFGFFYLLIGFARIYAVGMGEPVDRIPFLDAPWEFLFSLFR
jgi:hypothetical protein